MIKIGKYVYTHGIRGEIRIRSDFSRKDLVFKKGFKIYINGNEYIIKSYRKHKEYDMVTLDGINNINDIISLKGNFVYIKRDDIEGFIDEDLFSYKVIICGKEYKIVDILDNKAHKILVLEGKIMVPYVDGFIERKDNNEKIVYMKLPDNLL